MKSSDNEPKGEGMIIYGFGTTYIVADPAHLWNKDKVAMIVPLGSVMHLAGEGEVITLGISEDKTERWIYIKDFKLDPSQITCREVHVTFGEGSDFTSEDEFIDTMFDVWFTEYRKQHSAVVDSFREPLRRTFVDGWKACERFYESEE